MPSETSMEATSIETTHDTDQQQFQLKAFDALIPTFQVMAPMVLYLINEVVVLSETRYLEHPAPIDFENRYLELLFPLIISPNAP